MKNFLRNLFGSDDPQYITIVSGLPRSGTSMVMKMLEAGGIPPLTDKIRTPDEDNPKGYYEFERVKQLDKGDTAWVAEAHGKAVKVISQLLKHLPSEYEYRVLFVQRHMDEILASQKKMLVNRGEETNKTGDEELAALFNKHLHSVKQWLIGQSNMPVLYVHYSDILATPMLQAERINHFLDGALDTEAMATVVDPTLYRNRKESLSG